MSTKLLLIAFSLLFITSSCHKQSDKTHLVVDTKCELPLPTRFRMSSDPFPISITSPSQEGLDTLHASGSAQFSEDGLKNIEQKTAPYALTVFDLRQESHGFINKEPVTWLGKHNWSNKGKTLAEIEEDEKKKLKNGTTEQALCQSMNIGYIRIPVQDNCRPTDAEVNRFIAFVKSLPDNSWAHFHCYAGMGRTTLFLVMYDMMKNAKQISFDDIIVRQELLGGIDLRKTEKATPKLSKYLTERRDFIKQFYAYCKTNDDNFKTPFRS